MIQLKALSNRILTHELMGKRDNLTILVIKGEGGSKGEGERTSKRTYGNPLTDPKHSPFIRSPHDRRWSLRRQNERGRQHR